MRRVAILALLPALLLAGCASSDSEDRSPASGDTAGTGGTYMQTSYSVQANLTPPITTYTVVYTTTGFMMGTGSTAAQEEGRTFTWSNSNACGRWTPGNATATWYHGEDTNCPHDSPVHPGTISVVVGGLGNETSSTGYMTCEYTQGSATGRGAACFVSSVAPAGKEAARSTSIPAPGVALALAVVALAALAARRR